MSDVISITTHGRSPADDTGDGDKRALSHIAHIQQAETLRTGPRIHPQSRTPSVVVPVSVSRAPAPRPYVAEARERSDTTIITAIDVLRSVLGGRRYTERHPPHEPGLDGGF